MYRAQFFRRQRDRRHNIGVATWLRASSVDVATAAAWALEFPDDAEFVEVTCDGKVVSTMPLGSNVERLFGT